MGLKLMAFDTAMSSVLNSSGFIAPTFEKVEEGEGEDPGVSQVAFSATTAPVATT